MNIYILPYQSTRNRKALLILTRWKREERRSISKRSMVLSIFNFSERFMNKYYYNLEISKKRMLFINDTDFEYNNCTGL